MTVTSRDQEAPSAPLRLVLLGGARLEGPLPIPRLEKKSAALVAYLAVEGATPRSRIAGLLWPESRESTARNNLAQAVRRLRQASGAPFVAGDETVELRGTTSDVAELLLAVHQGRTADAAALPLSAGSGELLGGYDLDECVDFDRWLRSTRAHLLRTWSRAVGLEIDRAEAESRLDDALALAERLLGAEPLSEAAHLRAARLWLAKGDAPAAMRAYDRCKKTLARELAMKPSEAMLEVLRAIREGRAPTAPAGRPATPAALPASVLHPRWVGRAKEWADLERAWELRRGVVVSGSAGVGKSRLLREFVERKGPGAFVEGRPGDADVPYASLARTLRALLVGKAAERRAKVEPWAALELGRVVPELCGDSTGAPSLRSKLRFLEAVAHALELVAAAGFVAFVVDDLQWVDPASIEAVEWIAERCWGRELPLFAVIAHREDELPEATAVRVERIVRAGLATPVVLGPLAADEALELVRSLKLPALEGRLSTIADASHGVPLFLLEIVRAALDAGADEGRVPIPDRVKALVRSRLDRLGDAPLRLARVAAIAGPSFDLGLAAHVLGASPLDLAGPWAALEGAQVLATGRIAHDVVSEVLRDELPGVVREHVHARTAEYLARAGADPALVAYHLEAGGRELEAGPYLMRAALSARELSRVSEATAMYHRAANAFEAAGDRSAACDALFQLARGAVGAAGEALADRLDALAETPRDRARARSFRAGVDIDAGRFEPADQAAVEAEALARSVGDRLVVAKALQIRVDVALRAARLEGVDAILDAFHGVVKELGDPEGLAAAELHRGEVELVRDRPAAALPHVALALTHMETWGQMLYAKAHVLAVMARAHVALGDHVAAERALLDAEAALRDASGATGAQARVQLARAELALAKHEPEAALAALGELPEADPARRDVRIARVLRGEARLATGEVEAADADFAAIAKDPLVDVRLRGRAALGRARVAVARGQAPTPAVTKLVETLGGPRDLAALRALRP